ncbi:hypothetical protein ABZW49_29260 [Nonomuraea wenchangensis]
MSTYLVFGATGTVGRRVAGGWSGAAPPYEPQQPNAVARWHATVERLIERSGMAWTVLWWSAQIRTGDCVRGAFGPLTTTPIHEDFGGDQR